MHPAVPRQLLRPILNRRSVYSIGCAIIEHASSLCATIKDNVPLDLAESERRRRRARESKNVTVCLAYYMRRLQCFVAQCVQEYIEDAQDKTEYRCN